jgi:hypothetical protein
MVPFYSLKMRKTCYNHINIRDVSRHLTSMLINSHLTILLTYIYMCFDILYMDKETNNNEMENLHIYVCFDILYMDKETNNNKMEN